MLTLECRTTTVTKQGLHVLLVEDHRVVREHMKRSLNRMQEVAIVDEASLGRDALDLALRENFDVMLLDIILPDTSGLEILATIKSKKPNLPVLLFSVYPEIPYALQMLKAGAAGYLNKETALENLSNAIRKISEGGLYISPNLSQYLSSLFAGDPVRTLKEVLSDQEFQVFKYLKLEWSLAQISNEMSMSENQVNKAQMRILDLADLFNDADLIDINSNKGFPTNHL